jgi:hypothetical protein
VTEPWQIAHQLTKVTDRFTLDVLDVEPGIIQWIEKARIYPPQGADIPPGLYDKAASDKLHPILGDVLDLSLHEQLGNEYDLVVASGVLDNLTRDPMEKRSLSIASFLLLISHLRPDGVFLTDSETVRDFAGSIGFNNLVWSPYEAENMPISAQLIL